MTIWNNLKSMYRSMDLFGVPLNLRIGNRDSYKTYFGANLSFLIYGLILQSLYSLVEEVFTQSNPFVVQQDEY